MKNGQIGALNRILNDPPLDHPLTRGLAEGTTACNLGSMSSKETSSSRPYETPAQKTAKGVFVLSSLAVIVFASMVMFRPIRVGRGGQNLSFAPFLRCTFDRYCIAHLTCTDSVSVSIEFVLNPCCAAAIPRRGRQGAGGVPDPMGMLHRRRILPHRKVL